MYRFTKENTGVIRLSDNASIPADPDNIDWQAYLAWQSSGGTPLPHHTLEEAQEIVWEQIKSERDRRAKASGVLVSGKWFHTDLDSQMKHVGNKDTARDQLAVGNSMDALLLDPDSGQQIVWKTMDGSWLGLTCQIAFDVVKATKANEFAHFRAAEQHRAAMVAAVDPLAYDYSGGWPPAYGG